MLALRRDGHQQLIIRWAPEFRVCCISEAGDSLTGPFQDVGVVKSRVVPRTVVDVIAAQRGAQLGVQGGVQEWRHHVRSGLKQLQDGRVRFYRETELFRIYASMLVPGLLQTEGYAAAVLGMAASFHDLPTDDSAEAARARVERSRVIHESGHRFVVVIEEWVLYCQVADTDAMAAQLGYLLTAGALPAVSLGIIPMATRRRKQWPEETFHVYDDKLVSVELVSAEVKVTQPSEIALYLRTFEELRGMAVYGAAARALVVKAIEALR